MEVDSFPSSLDGLVGNIHSPTRHAGIEPLSDIMCFEKVVVPGLWLIQPISHISYPYLAGEFRKRDSQL